MTLCIAWRTANNLSLLSDSRLTKPNGTHLSNNANKIFSIRIGVTNKTKGEVVFDSTYGMCFAGSYLNGSNLADTISELTSNIVLYGEETIDYDQIAEIAFILYEYISRHLMELNGEKGNSEVFFIGYCPKTRTNKINKFSSKIGGNGEIEFVNAPIILREKEFVYLGSLDAIGKAKELEIKVKYPYTEFHLLDEIIQTEEIATVGGCIQYGCIVANKFRLYGIVDYELYEPLNNTDTFKEAYRVKNVFLFRSIPFNWEDPKLSKLSTRLDKLLMAPFIDRQKRISLEAIQKNNNIKS